MVTGNYPVSPSTAVLAALEASDSASRAQRALRIEWMSQFKLEPGSIIHGQVETLSLLRESKSCFADGHFVATLLVSMSFIEHALTTILDSRNLSSKAPGIGGALKLARTHGILPTELLDQTEALQQRRNPFAHKRLPDDKHGLSDRYLKEKRHPDAIIQEDAEESLRLAHIFFVHATERV